MTLLELDRIKEAALAIAVERSKAYHAGDRRTDSLREIRDRCGFSNTVARFYGLDFSGAIGRSGDKKRTIAALGPDLELVELASGFSFEAIVAAVSNSPSGSWWGMDFPIGLPAPYLDDDGRSGLARTLEFVSKCGDPDSFRASCSSTTARAFPGRKELKRACDREFQTPFAASNLRMYKQTFRGLTEVIAPLAKLDQIAILPWDWKQLSTPRVRLFEACPASMLRAFDRYASYKGRTTEAREARSGLVAFFRESGLTISTEQSDRLTEDHEGDLIDAVLCAWASYRVANDPELPYRCQSTEALAEGWVFF